MKIPLSSNSRLLIDNSSLELLECPRRFLYGFVRKREGGNTAARNFGSAMHLYWKVRYRGRSLSEAQANALLSSYFRRHPQPEGEWRSLELAQCAVQVYEKKWRGCDFVGKPRVEQSFLLPFGQIAQYEVWYMGRIDLFGFEHEGTQDWIADHKTTSVYGPSFWADQSMSAQHRGYCWAYQQVTGALPRGYCVNAMRTRRPTKVEEYDPTKGIRPDDFDRQYFYITPEDIVEWYNDTFNLIDNAIYMANRGAFPMFRRACQGKYGQCDYFPVCSMPFQSREELLNSSLYSPKVWSPLNV